MDERFKEDWVPVMVDYLPEPEREVVTALFWEQVSLRAVAARLGWRLPGGDWDAKKVERMRASALSRIERLIGQLVPLLQEMGFRDPEQVDES